MNIYRDIIKRKIDVFVVCLAFIPLIPLVLLIICCQYLVGSTPIIFSQLRPGKNGIPFYIYKFRTMNNACNAQGVLHSDAIRLTRFGKFLRSTSLDELPSLINVLKGEMSLIGPRPLLMQYLDRYTPEQARRHKVKPGITGWAQVNGRNAISWEEKFKLDVWYVDHMSFWLDLKILWLTSWKVMKRADISQKDHATIEEFMGSVSD